MKKSKYIIVLDAEARLRATVEVEAGSDKEALGLAERLVLDTPRKDLFDIRQVSSIDYKIVKEEKLEDSDIDKKGSADDIVKDYEGLIDEAELFLQGLDEIKKDLGNE